MDYSNVIRQVEIEIAQHEFEIRVLKRVKEYFLKDNEGDKKGDCSKLESEIKPPKEQEASVAHKQPLLCSEKGIHIRVLTDGSLRYMVNVYVSHLRKCVWGGQHDTIEAARKVRDKILAEGCAPVVEQNVEPENTQIETTSDDSGDNLCDYGWVCMKCRHHHSIRLRPVVCENPNCRGTTFRKELN
jgi:hypothetical protein